MAVLYSDLGTSVKMRLYSLQKRHILMVFVTFFASFFLSITIGLIGYYLILNKSHENNSLFNFCHII
jgi:hypothetical protein